MVSMVNTAAFSRIKASITCAIVLAFLVAELVEDIPDYGKNIYKSAETVDYDEYEDQTGFPAGQGYEELTGRKEIFDAEKNYILKVDVKDLQPVKLYRKIQEETYYKNKFSKYIFANSNGGVGTYYIAKLKSGEKIIVFIDDRVFTVPKSGMVELPVASTDSITDPWVLSRLQNLTGLSEEELQYYVDTAGKWRQSTDGEKMSDKATVRGMVTFVIVVVPFGFLFAYIEKLGAKKENE